MIDYANTQRLAPNGFAATARRVLFGKPDDNGQGTWSWKARTQSLST